mgnify:CR=1 FL=1
MTSQPPIAINITASPVQNLDQLQRQWLELEGQSSGHSFFVSWHWIGAWLRNLPASIQPQLLRVNDAGKTIGLGILVSGTSRILKIFQLPQISLNETGDPAFDTLTTEYNGLLTADGYGAPATQAALDWILGTANQERVLSLGGVDDQTSELAANSALHHGHSVRIINCADAPWVDLDAIRSSGKTYLDRLSRNSRQALRRELRRYETIGPLKYQVANTTTEALENFAALGQLHQTRWKSKGKPGAFAQEFFAKFHNDLIASAFAGGHIEMANISAGGELIGYLYNFKWRGNVYAYQSGFNYDDNYEYKPGYVSHYLAILYALESGQSCYDFMAGYGQHKSSLSTETRHLHWLQIRPKHILVRLENRIRKLVNWPV